ncbi:WXG100 family type VII secretion target [Streptomyces sp. NPDC001514]
MMPDPNNLTDGYIYVDYSRMNNACGDLMEATNWIEEVLSTLDQELGALKATWDGDDRQAYGERQAAWNGVVANMKQLLSNHSTLLDDVSGRYRQGQNNITQMWESVRVGR